MHTDLFDNLQTIVGTPSLPLSLRLKLLHETLVLVCAEALKASKYGFGDLNAQLESVIRLFQIPNDEANALRQARRDSNHSQLTDGDGETIVRYDCAAVARLISRVFKTDIPSELTSTLPHDLKPAADRLKQNAPDKRCIVKAFDEQTISVIIDEDGAETEKTVYYTRQTQYAHMDYLHDLLRPGMHLNLLGCQTEGDTITPRLIIVEPDCLMDISVIASCFEDYGHHPLMYFLSRIRERANHRLSCSETMREHAWTTSSTTPISPPHAHSSRTSATKHSNMRPVPTSMAQSSRRMPHDRHRTSWGSSTNCKRTMTSQRRSWSRHLSVRSSDCKDAWTS